MGVNPQDRAARDAYDSRVRDKVAGRRREAEHGRAQAYAKETIPATGRHHRKDGH